MQLDPAISWAVSLSVAVLFATAATHKLRDWKRFCEVVRNYRMVPAALVSLAALISVAFELSAAVLVLLVPTRPIGAALSATVLVAYAAAMAINLRRGRINLDCGCLGFGRRQPVRWWMVGRNGALAVFSLIAAQPVLPRALTALDGVTIVCATLSLAILYLAQGLLGSTAHALSR